MFLKNTLIPGDFLCPVPSGLHITLQYNASGNLEKVFKRTAADREELSDKLFQKLIRHESVPARIHINGGTSWVKGVLHTGVLFPIAGKLPFNMEEQFIERFTDNPSQFNFFAWGIDSTAAKFRGSTPIRQCLSMSRFNLLPGMLIPSNISKEVFFNWFNSDICPFSNSVITDYVIFRKEEIKLVSTQMKQFVISKVHTYVDDNGFIKAKLFKSDSSEFLAIDYSELLKYNIQPNTLVILDAENQVTVVKHLGKQDKPYSKSLTCAYCGKKFDAPSVGSVQCPNPHCTSKLVPVIQQFIAKTGLPDCSSEFIQEKINRNEILCVTDLFVLPEFEGVQVEITLAALLRALVPISTIPRDEIFTVFATACTNNPQTFRYYIKYPANAEKDLGLRHPDMPKLQAWLSDDANLSDIETLLNTPQIVIKQTDKKFEGAPIFRNKTVYITGDFTHGSVSEIAAILQSYSAKVVTQFSDVADCVLVGGKKSNIDGKSVNAARHMCTPIIDEAEFFREYGIDEDLRNNLVYS